MSILALFKFFSNMPQVGSHPNKLKLGILVSGNGSNLEAIIAAAKSGKIPAEVAVVISDNPAAYAIERAKKYGVPFKVFERKDFPSREEFEKDIVATLLEYKVTLVCLAGFMRILGKTLLEAYKNKIINIHPALLPAFPGLDAQKQALEHGAKISGCTVHFVDEKIDHGTIILQAKVPVEENDTVETLKERILKEEHRIYPEAIKMVIEKIRCHCEEPEGRRGNPGK